MTDRIVLKNLAREFDVDPYKLRMMLRKEFGKRHSWRWNVDDPELRRVREFLGKAIDKTTFED